MTRETIKTDGVRCGRVHAAVERLLESERPRYRRLWAYYRNPMRVCGTAGGGVTESPSDRPYRQAQEWGLPPRITGVRCGTEPFTSTAPAGVERKEVVIENDIAWRVATMVDYLFGRPLVISSAAPDPARRETIGKLLRAIVAANGGIQFLQEMATLGAVYGFVDVLVKLDGAARPDDVRQCGTRALGEAPAAAGGTAAAAAAKSPSDAQPASEARNGAGPGDREPIAKGGAAPTARGDDGRIAGGTTADDDALLQRAARMIRLEIVEPARALPLLSPADYRVVEAYGQVWEREPAAGGGQSAVKSHWWDRVRQLMAPDGRASLRETGRRSEVIELITPDWWGRFEGDRLVAQGANSLGEVPLVHVQNTAAAFEYAGQSDVEPLIPLQDELNTRLSDRAHRITLQSFKMYLGKGIDQFADQPVSPGRVWMSENEQASIQEFGGDAHAPSEEAHIADLREALDKTSGVTPVAAGAIKNRIGRLTSAAALRVTLLALLSKTDKKRALYGAGVERVCQLALRWLDVAGVFPTTEPERRVELSWPSPLPENALEKLQEAEAKVRLGVDRAVVLRELGY